MDKGFSWFGLEKRMLKTIVRLMMLCLIFCCGICVTKLYVYAEQQSAEFKRDADSAASESPLEISLPSGKLQCISCSPDEKSIAIGTNKGLFVLGLAEMKFSKAMFVNKSVKLVRFSSDGKYLCAAVAEKKQMAGCRIFLLNLASGSQNVIPWKFEKTGIVDNIAAADRYMAVSVLVKDLLTQVSLIDTNTGKVVSVLDGELSCRDLRFSDKDRKNVLTVFFSNHMNNYDVNTGKLLSSVFYKSEKIGPFAFRDKKYAEITDEIITYKENRIRFVDIRNFKNATELKLSGNFNISRAVRSSSDGRIMCFFGSEFSGGKKTGRHFLFVCDTIKRKQAKPPIWLQTDFCLYDVSPSGKMLVYSDGLKIIIINL